MVEENECWWLFDSFELGLYLVEIIEPSLVPVGALSAISIASPNFCNLCSSKTLTRWISPSASLIIAIYNVCLWCSSVIIRGVSRIVKSDRFSWSLNLIILQSSVSERPSFGRSVLKDFRWRRNLMPVLGNLISSNVMVSQRATGWESSNFSREAFVVHGLQLECHCCFMVSTQTK